MRLQGKVAIVTGAGGGFGEAIAKRFAAEGADVVLVDLKQDQLDRVAAEIGRAGLAVQADVAQGDQVRNVVETAWSKFGRIDILVNNAGVTHRNQSFLTIDEAAFDRVFAVNVKSIFHFMNAVVPKMKSARNGAVLNIGSTAGIRPRPGLSWYNATKGAVALATKSLAVELAPDNIRVNNICPVMSGTGLISDFLGVPDTPEARAKVIASIPLGRMSEPQDIASAAVFLASDEAAFITGIDLPVDGGRTI